MWCEPLKTESHPECDLWTYGASKMFVFAKAVCSPALTDEHSNCVCTYWQKSVSWFMQKDT